MRLFLVLVTLIFGLAFASHKSELRPLDDFASISNEQERSLALFTEAGKVITNPRCVNCHPASDRPTQGAEMHPHQPPVVRGDGGLGAVGMRCTTCHGEKNFDPAHVPGAPNWHLAPLEMAWEGKSLGEICQQIKDPQRNGGKTMPAIIEHMSQDALVGWAWAPGVARQPATGTQESFGKLIAAWVDTGAVCPDIP